MLEQALPLGTAASILFHITIHNAPLCVHCDYEQKQINMMDRTSELLLGGDEYYRSNNQAGHIMPYLFL